MGKLKGHYYQMLENNREELMNSRFTEEEIDDAMKEFEKILDKEEKQVKEDFDKKEDWSQDSDLFMKNGVHGDEEEKQESIDKSVNILLEIQKENDQKRIEESNPGEYLGKRVKTRYGTGYIHGVFNNIKRGLYWIIKLDAPVHNNVGGDTFRTCYRADFAFMEEAKEKPFVNIGVNIGFEEHINNLNKVHRNLVEDAKEFREFKFDEGPLDNDGQGKPPKCECGIASVYREHHAQMHDARCPLNDKKNW